MFSCFNVFMTKVIGLIGEMAAGKSTATDYLKKNFGAITFRFSDALRDVAKRLGIEDTRANLQNLSTALRQAFGDDLLAKAMHAAVQNSSAPLIIVEGIRRPADMLYLKKLPQFKLIYLQVDERTRYDRLKLRRENADDATKTWEQFQTDGAQESEQKIKEIASEAEVVIDNNHTLDELYARLNTILK